ncbi:probable RPL28 - 60S large subunit ribosomal protein L27a.e [Cephalotrichum gorgonifer]|uniref:Large ribosomal subunit protein uL15 n=1 Tax=Cephalotrichum gorgonifer TaxID=2041049 RepID=A0AAE8SYA1_9PEZI|nr:probable RPL28 - 60S large subunit ribosomal protein L27a.e [Cephalotrichum gorgonifer]
MPTRFSKTRKHRGHVSAGKGRASTGSIPEVVVWLVVSTSELKPRYLSPRAQLEDANVSSLPATKYHYGYFGKVGMRYFHKQQNHFWRPSINIDKLWSLVPTETREAYLSGEKKDTAPVLDLLPLGYSKVLGKGRIPEIPIVVRARYVSKLAEEKIVAAGGVVELVA